jgi:DNA-binding CsgD family transcriptional regulator
MSVMTAELLERDGERSVLSSLVARTAAGEGGVVVVEAPAGVGKTELLRTVAQLGEEAGLTVLRGRGSELDRAFAFGVVRQMLAREVAQDPGLLTGGAEMAGPVLAPTSEEGPGDLLGSLEGLQWLVANLAARNPVLIVADDLHWADRPSLRWLVFLAERIEDVAVLLVGATRPAEPGADQELLDALATTPLNHLLRPAPLSPAATLTVVRRRLPDATEPFAEACHRATGGNPFLLGELLGELASEGRAGTAEEAGDVLDFGSERVARAVRRRLRLQPADALSLARAVAVLGPGTPLAQAAGLAGIDEDAAGHAADALVAVNLLAADRALDFVHPVVAAAVYEDIPPHERQELHAAAARLLTAAGAESEQVARHLLRLPPSGDAELATALRAAADEALGRGATEAATNYLRRALEESPGPEERVAILHQLGVTEAADLQTDRFPGHFREALDATSDGEARARIALDFARALLSTGSFRAGVEVFSEGLSSLDDRESDLALTLETELGAVALYDRCWDDIAEGARNRRLAQFEAGEDLTPTTLAGLLLPMSTMWGPAQRAIDLADRILASTRFEEPNSVMGAAIGNCLLYSGALSRAGAFYDQAMTLSRRRGARITFAWQNVMRSTVSLHLGELRRAESEGRVAFDLFHGRVGEDAGLGQTGWTWTVNSLAEALVARGAFEEAEALIGELPLSRATTFTQACARVIVANAHLGLGRPSLALQEAQEAGRLVSPTFTNSLSCAWRAPAAIALAALGRGDEAVEMAEQELADARRFELPLTEGSALRTLGLVTGGKDGLQLLRDSVTTLEATEGRYSHARSVLELGAALRRAGERAEARDVLREALALTSHMGASALADRAHEELVAAGARPRRERRMLSGRESLTASEDRVATLAAEGLSNREIAQRLFVTIKAVQFHLRNVYRKLDVDSREGLPAALELGA